MIVVVGASQISASTRVILLLDVQDIAQIDERTQLLKKNLDVLVKAGNERVGQLEEDIAQINEKIRGWIDVFTVQTEHEDFGWLSSPLFDGEEVKRTKRNREWRAKGTKQKRPKEWDKALGAPGLWQLFDPCLGGRCSAFRG